MARPLDGGRADADSQIGGMFDPHAKARTDLFDDVTSPAHQRHPDQVEADMRRSIDSEGDVSVRMEDGQPQRPMSSVLDELAKDRDFLDVLDLCGRPRT